MNNFTNALHDEKTFYNAFLRDLEDCQSEVIIESPFITTERMNQLRPVLTKLISRGVKVFIVTRDPNEHTDNYEIQSEAAVRFCEALGVQVLLCSGNHHRKLAILDRTVLWEGSLNILSQIHSREIMRRLEGGGFAVDMFNFINFGRYI
jgi:phosphatidylserine/phosphatidylglycerophosphate/cardiolipin synthase-like enzyme